jgi:hypothetical protein
VPDWDSTERNDSDEDAAWRELIARYDSPMDAEGPAPWPDREETGDTGAPPPSHIVIAAIPARIIGSAAPRTESGTGPENEDEDRFVPPPPPPLPKLDPLTKGAWAMLFGGPGYLLIATAAGWTLPGVAVFCAVAAFVAGVALLVFKLTDSDRDDSDDDGAIV